MKKKILVVLLVILIAVIALAGCNSTKKIDRFYEKLNETENLTIVMEMTIPVAGKVAFTVEGDGNKGHMSAFMEEAEQYVETVGDIEYVYTKNPFGNWIKTEQAASETDDYAASEFEEVFKSENYSYSKD